MKKTTSATNHFPSRLHDMLDDASKKGHREIVSWSQSGLSFKIHDTNAIVPILANYFRQTKYKSLLRQLQGYGFKRVTNGEMKGQVSHPMFVRGNRKACMQMKRKQGKTSTTSTSKSSNTATNTTATTNTKSSSSSKKKSNNKHNIIENIIAATVTALPMGVTSGASSSSSCSSQAAAQQQPILPAEFRQPLPQEALSSSSARNGSSVRRIVPKAAQQQLQILPSSCTSSSSASTSGERKPLEINLQMGGQQFPNTTHPFHYQQQQQQQDRNHNQTGLDALQVEIGCTFSTSPATSNSSNNIIKSCSSSSLKRTAPSQQQRYHNHFVAHKNTESQLFKRQRDSNNSEQQQRHHFKVPLLNQYNSSSSFSLPMKGGNNNARSQFDQLEKLIQFSPQEMLSSSSCSTQQQNKHTQQQQHQQLLFHQTMDAAGSSFGCLDLDISLTTTTTTTTHRPNVNVESSSSSQVVCNNQQFVLPFELEPTPFRTAENSNHSSNQNSNIITADNTITNSNIITSTFLPKPVSVSVAKDTPTTTPTRSSSSSSNIVDINVLEKVIPTSSFTKQQQLSSEARSDLVSEISDDIDMQIAHAFDDDSDDKEEVCDNHGWPMTLQQQHQQYDQTTTNTNITCDTAVNCEEKEQGQGKKYDVWTKGVHQIVFNGTSDCVLEPELFQLEAQRLQSTNDIDNNSNINNAQQQQRPLQQPSYPQQPHHQHVFLQQQKQRRQMMMVQQQQQGNIHHLVGHGHLPVQQQRLQQSQGLAVGPYPIISKPMAFAPRPRLHTEIA